MPANEKPRSRATHSALRLLGSRIRLARRERGWRIEELAQRVGVSHVTIRKVEQGAPSVAIGTVFEAAVLVGVPLFHEDLDRLRIEASRVTDRLALLPERIRSGTPDDAF